jgi:hypothetical protein
LQGNDVSQDTGFVQADAAGLHEDENAVLFLKFTLGLGQIIFAAPIECRTDHFGNCVTSWRKELNKRGWSIGAMKIKEGDMKTKEGERVAVTCPHQFLMGALIHQFA